jgi:kinesin family protein 5
VTVSSAHSPPFKCALDRIFPDTASQESVYAVTAEPLIDAVFEGFNSTILTYGQTGSGKTYTMTGTLGNKCEEGVIPRMVTAVFDRIESASEVLEFTMKLGYCEIYMERIKDLLDPVKNNLKVHEDKTRGVFISNLTEQYVTEEEEVYELMKVGNENREVGATLMNEGSSRSHAIFILTLSQSNTLDFSAKSSKLYLVDLAGSEKVGKTGAEGRRLDEAKLINKSLSTLGLVIYSLTDSKVTHVPYRDSKLTRVLQDSLGGNAKTTLIITCSPSPYNAAETLDTLRFGVRAKSIRNQPKVNKELSITELKMLLSKADSDSQKREKRIEHLERLLSAHGIDIEEPISARIPTQEEPEEEDKDLALLHPEIDRLQTQLDELQSRLSEEMTNNEALRIESKDSHEQALMAEHQVLMLTSQVMNLKTENQTIREESIEKDDWMHQLTTMRDSLTSELARINVLKSALEAKVQTLQDDAERAALEAAKTDRVGSFLRANPRLTEELELKDIQIKELQSRLEARESLLAQIRDRTTDKSISLLIRNSDRGDSIENTKDLLHKAQDRIRSLFNELAQTKSASERLMKTKVPNLDDIRRTISEEAVNQAEKLWEEERFQLNNDLQNRVEKVIRLEIEIDEAHESYRALEQSVRGGDSAMVQKVTFLEKKLDELAANYHNLFSQGSYLKMENEVLAKRVQRKTDKVKSLEIDLKQAQDQLQALTGKVDALVAETQDLKTRGFYARSTTSFASNRLKRPIKGGARLAAYQTHEIEEM